MATFSYLLDFAGVPFCIDKAQVVRLSEPRPDETAYLPPRKYQPEANFIDELNRLIPFSWMVDFSPPKRRLGRNLNALANQLSPDEFPNYTVKIGEYFYPTGAARWSVFRGLATSSMVKEMVRLTVGGATAATFRMKSVPQGNPEGRDAGYTISTSMYMLPPRPLGEMGGSFDGLYLVTLCDERYKWQYRPVSLTVDWRTTWASLISSIATGLGASVTTGTIADAYLQPESDSQFWCNRENAAVLMDAAAANVGKVFVRALAGTYSLLTNAQSLTQVLANRGSAKTIVRTAGGDMFASGNLRLPVGSLAENSPNWPNSVKNAVIPSSIDVSFPKYDIGSDPVPHIFNSRYKNQRPSCWYEDSYGDTHVVNVPLTSGPLLTSGHSGVGTHCLHSTAKALYSGEVQATPLNNSGLTALAMQLAVDYWDQQADAALDEIYPGTLAWVPEGFNDILWTYSANVRQATCRVMRAEWNQIVREYQHSTPTISGLANIPYTNTPVGVGGPSVAQSWRDAWTYYLPSTTAAGAIASGDMTITFTAADYFPFQNRWRLAINSGASDHEYCLMEGTSGGTSVGVVWRGIDGSYQQAHAGGASLIPVQPDYSWGVNLGASEKMQWVFPGQWTSGGVSEAVIVPQTQTVLCLASSGKSINSIDHWSGYVEVYNPTLTSGSQFPNRELIWIVERNGSPLKSGVRYDGQFVAPASKNGPAIAPIYAVNDCCVASGGTVFFGSGTFTTVTVTSGIYLQGNLIGRDIGCKIENSTSQNIPSGGTPTAVTYDQEEYDTDTMHSTSSNTSRITATTAGKYEVNFAGEVSLGGSVATAGSYITAQFYVNGAANDGKQNSEFQSEDPPGTGSTTYNASFMLSMEFNLAANDYVETFITNNDAATAGTLTNQVSWARKQDRAG